MIIIIQYKWNMQSPFLLFASASVHEAGPLKTGLLAAHPENRGDSHHQHHQIFNQEQNCSWMVGLLHLKWKERIKVNTHEVRHRRKQTRIPVGKNWTNTSNNRNTAGNRKLDMQEGEVIWLELLSCRNTLSNATSRGQQFAALRQSSDPCHPTLTTVLKRQKQKLNTAAVDKKGTVWYLLIRFTLWVKVMI